MNFMLSHDIKNFVSATSKVLPPGLRTVEREKFNYIPTSHGVSALRVGPDNLGEFRSTFIMYA